MKKLIYSLLTLAAALSLASCQPDKLLGGVNSNDDAFVDASFSVSLGPATKAFADAGNAKKLHIAFYSGGSLDATLSKVGDAAIDLESTSYNNTFKLRRGVAYDIICWAESNTSPYALDFTNKTVTYKDVTALVANNDTYDAFYGVASLSTEKTQNNFNQPITLTRPFAQINVLVPDSNADSYTSFSSTMTVTVPTTMSLADGTLSGSATAVTFGNATAPCNQSPDPGTLKDNHKYLAMNYVFAPVAAANYDVSFTVTPNVAADAKTINLTNVSLQRNRRTNIVGNIFQTEVEGSITINITSGMGGSNEEPTQSPDVTVAIGTAGASAVGNTAVALPISGNTPQNIQIESNSTGAVTFDQPLDDSVATLTDNGNGSATVNPVGNGTTTFVAHIAAGETKANLRSKDITFEVTVTGISADPTLEITGTPNAKTNAPFELTVNTNSTGNVTFDVDPNTAATVALKTGSTNVYTVTPATNLTDDTDVTITFTVAAVTGVYNEKSVPVVFQVAKATPTTITKTMSEIVSDNQYTVSAGTSATCYTSFSLDANVSVSTSGDANCGSFWGTAPDIDWRLYQAQSGDITISVSGGKSIQKVTITYNTKNTGVLKNGDTTILSGSEQTVSGSSVTFTVGNSGAATNGQVKVTSISVTYL